MSLTKLTIEMNGLGDAKALAEHLDMSEPIPLATSLFENQDADGAAVGGWRVDAYFEEAPDLEALRQTAADLLDRARSISVDAVPDENWVAISQAALPPVSAGRYCIHGSHDRQRVGRRLHAIEIDAGEAFGTAHHATTEGCLQAIDRLTRRRRFNSVLDLGCGSGVLAIAAAQALPQASIVASDIDGEAVRVAAANIRSNRLGGRIRVYTATGLAHAALRGDGSFDLVTANILAGPLIGLAPHLARAIMPGGIAILSGLLADQAREVAAAYRMSGFRLQEKQILTGWATLVVARTSQ